jgi:TolB-like protein/Tfp pilus assembly protein PilF
MASIIPGYEYDIFISYRQKDNKGDRWVSEFVEALKTELESTFKEEISVYFDINPHDGLLETHNVDASLKEKLKCLVFIPIISQTYCDSKSFAWQHELVAFNKMAKEDQFGRDIRLAGGNVASRILPIKIHDLDAEDKALLENELGGVLRSIDFIYKASGVNRPLKPNDERTENLNHTFYRDQINKVANAVKEIITAIKKHNQQDDEVPKKVVKAEPELLKNLKPKIIIVSFFVLALLVLGYFIIPKLFNSSKPVDKSIAVLPFRLLSNEPDKQYLADGMMEAILLHMQKFKDLRVLDRTSVEQYRETKKTTYVIGQELGVTYLLEGSFQKAGDSVRLDVRLIYAKKQSTKWGNEYNKNWKDNFAVQSEVAQTIAKELHITITPEVKQLIEKTPTKNLTAYDFYQRGREEYTKYWIDKYNTGVLQKDILQKAEDLYRKALKYDSTFAQAYTGMANIYWSKHYYEEYFSKNFLDSVLILANIALSYDNRLSEAYIVRGQYYYEIGKSDESLKEFDRAIQLNPNDWMAYMSRGELYSNNDFVKSLENDHKAISLNRDSKKLPVLFRNISLVYSFAGFKDKAIYYIKEKTKLDNDSLAYYKDLGFGEETNGNYSNALSLYKRSYALDTTNIDVLWNIGNTYVFLEKYNEALKWFKRFLKHPDYFGYVSIIGHNRIGLAFWKNGFKDEARLYFEKHVNYLTRADELGRATQGSFENAYDIAGVYAFLGEKEKAYEKLRFASRSQIENLYFSTYVKNDATFESYRNDPVFQQYVRDVEAKYQAEHERVRKWLEAQGKL